jgi:hypothetical protein
VLPSPPLAIQSDYFNFKTKKETNYQHKRN